MRGVSIHQDSLRRNVRSQQGLVFFGQEQDEAGALEQAQIVVT